MQNFEISNESNLTQLPIKKRIALMQKMNAEAGNPISWNVAKATLKQLNNCTTYINNKYQVLFYKGKQANFFVHAKEFQNLCDYLSIKRIDKEPIHDWRDLQSIKNMLCGSDREAIEIYPNENRLVDTANQYHLIVFPKDYILPFGYTKREVIYNDSNVNGFKTKQRQK